MTTFADTSGLYALLDADNVAHEVAAAAWHGVQRGAGRIVTSNYVVVETATLLQSRLGLKSVRDLLEKVVPVLEVEWIGRESHEAGMASVMSANRRDVSLVDCVSFEVMRRLGIRRAFTLDEHFGEQGFEVVP